MKGPLRIRNAGDEGVRLTIGPVWADIPKEEAIAIWEKLGQELGILCDGHRLENKLTPAAKCQRCGQLVEADKIHK